MSERKWQDHIVGDRMAVDREFSQRVADSEFSSQEWGLIMTATEFRIEDPTSEEPRLVADTSKVEQIAGELDDIRESMGPMGPAGGPGKDRGGDSGGLFGSVKSALGLGGDDAEGRDPQKVRSRADDLTDEYAQLLQQRLENEGRWEEITAMAAGEPPETDEE